MAYIGYIFAFYATKMGSSDSGETNVDPHWVQDPSWSFNGPYRAPEIDGPGHLYRFRSESTKIKKMRFLAIFE